MGESSWTTKHVTWAAIILIVFGVVLLLGMKKKAEEYKPTATTFLSKQQTQHFLQTDPDRYGASLNTTNLEACGVINYRDLLDKWQSAAAQWKPEEIKKLQDAALIADFHINTKLKDPFKAQLAAIDWHFAKTLFPFFCDGLPLTRTNIIFLTDKTVAEADTKRLASILVHEKVHIWERMYPEEMEGWIERKEFKKYRPIREDAFARANPDVDEWIYVDKNNQQRVIHFNSLTPKDLHDIRFHSPSIEHPYEVLAYAVQKIVS